jgi:hypothetical protein
MHKKIIFILTLVCTSPLLAAQKRSQGECKESPSQKSSTCNYYQEKFSQNHTSLQDNLSLLYKKLVLLTAKANESHNSIHQEEAFIKTILTKKP